MRVKVEMIPRHPRWMFWRHRWERVIPAFPWVDSHGVTHEAHEECFGCGKRRPT